MDFHESIDQARDRLDKAKAAYCLCNYDEALLILCQAYPNIRELIVYVYEQKCAAHQAPKGRVLSERELDEQLKWLQSQGGISSEGFGR